MNYSRQRKVILEVVKNHYDHPTADMIYKEAKKQLNSIGIATVYRNLKALEDAGEIRRIKTVDGKDCFDGRVKKHYHTRCKKCGMLKDLFIEDESQLSRVKEDMQKVLGAENMELELEETLFSYICDDCK